MDETTRDACREAFGRGHGTSDKDLTDRYEVVDQAIEQAIMAWPDLITECEPEVFAFALGERTEGMSEEQSREWFGQVEIPDLYLALASSLGGELAVGAFTEAYHQDIQAVARKFARSGLDAEESYQVLLTHILMPTTTGHTPRVGNYSGRGQLKNWVRVTSTRLFIDRLRKEKKLSSRHVSLDAEQVLVEEPRARDDVELDFLKSTYRQKFKDAFGSAIRALSPYQRNLLRQHHIGGVTLDRLASLHDVHRATIARHLSEARGALLTHTRKQMMDELVLASAEFESMMELIESQLEVSFSRLLHSTHHQRR